MRLNRISSLNFYGKIIDGHVHVGQWSENGVRRDYTSDLDKFVKSPLKNGDTVETVIVSNLDCMTHKNETGSSIEFVADEITGNKKLLELAEKNPYMVPLATCQPGYGSADNIRKLLEENPDKFVGFKFHPEQLNLPVSDSRYLDYMKLAEEKKLPCLFHSARTFDVSYPGGGVAKASKLSNPEQIYEFARKYKDVPVIMAHWGGDGEKNIDTTTKCIIESIKKGDAKLYADISWVDCDNPQKPNLKRIIEQLKAVDGLERVIFGTDAPLGRFSANGENGVPPKQAYEETVINIKNMIRREFPNDAEEIIDKIFYKNAGKLFGIKNHAQGPDDLPPQPTDGGKNSKTKIIFAIIGAVLLIGGACWYYYNKSKGKQPKSSDISA